MKAYSDARSRQVPEFAKKTVVAKDFTLVSLEVERDTGNCFIAYAVADSDMILTRHRSRSSKVADMDSIDGMNTIPDNSGTTVKIVYGMASRSLMGFFVSNRQRNCYTVLCISLVILLLQLLYDLFLFCFGYQSTTLVS